MASEAIVETIPLSTGPDGVVRVGGTRVTLDTVVAAFRDGLSAEGIAEQYPSLRLADVYSVLGYVLGHAAEVDAYLHARQESGAAVRTENEARFDPAGIRDRLLSRKSRG